MVLEIYKRSKMLLSGLVFLVAGLALEAGAAGPVFWDWPAVQPFVGLELEGATVDDQGFLMPGLGATSISGDGPEVYWRAIADGKGGYYTGTGHGGKILHTDDKGEVSVFAELEGSEVFSLLLLADGTLVAGCGPDGEVYTINRKGEAQLLGSVPGGYAWSLFEDKASKNILIAGGSPAALYRLDANGAIALVREFPAQNALDVTMAAGGGVLVATQGPGYVYHLDANLENSRLLLELDQDEARQFLRGPGGGLYVIGFNGDDQASEPKTGLQPGSDAESAAMLNMLFGETGPEVIRSALYLLHGDGLATPVWTSEMEFMAAAWDENLGWLGGGALDEDSGKSTLYALDLPSGQHPLAMWEGGDILDILTDDSFESGVDLIVCQAFPGSVTSLGNKGKGTHQGQCSPLDGGRPINWGRLSWEGIAGKGKLEWSVRGGNCSVPDDSWSQWSDSWSNENHAIGLEPCRFLQWRVIFPKSHGTAQSWRVTKVSVSAWQENSAPVITAFDLEQLVGLEAGSIMSGSDNVTQKFRSGLYAEFSRASSGRPDVDPSLKRLSRPIHVYSWKAKDVENDRLLYGLRYRKQGTEAWRSILVDSPDNLGSWDTSEVMDGLYEVQLTANDSRDNPYNLSLSASRILGPFKVDNNSPVIASLRLERQPAGFRVRFSASDASSAVAGAQIRLPDGSMERIDPQDGICDSFHETFDTVITWPRDGAAEETGSWLVGIVVQDLGGNVSAAEGEVQ